MTSAVLATLMAALLGWFAPQPAQDRFVRRFDAVMTGEAVASVRAGCATCDWGEAGREAAVLRVLLDGKYSQHIVLARGEASADYRIGLGQVTKGRHQLTVERDPALSARGAGASTIDVADVTVVPNLFPDGDDFTARSMAPILYARSNTVGRFTDVPLLMWYEIERTVRGRRFRYSVIFSNEDGGTQTDRLMATWGRTTDIEFVYGVEVDESGRMLDEEFQGPGHEVPPFKGRHEARHPLLWVSTDNNMVSESGSTRVRYALVPVKFDLTNVSREAVMDANPWTYAIASVEMRREGKIADDPPPGHNTIADPRRFVYVEACGTIGNAALALSVGSVPAGSVPAGSVPAGSVRLQPDRSAPAGSVRLQPDRDLIWTPSDRGLRQYRVVRDGCFRTATPLPPGTRASDIRAIRVQAYQRPPVEGTAPAPADPVRLTRINKVFMLDEHFLPGPSVLSWEGNATIRAGGEPFEVTVR